MRQSVYLTAIKLSLKCRSRALAAIGINAVFPSYSVAASHKPRSNLSLNLMAVSRLPPI